MRYEQGYESVAIGRLDLAAADHPDTYTGDVTAWHQRNTPWGDVQLYAETRTGQPVELCTLDCDDLLQRMLDDTDSEVVSSSDLPGKCRDFADVLTAYREALELLSRTKCRGGLGDDIQDFLNHHKAS